MLGIFVKDLYTVRKQAVWYAAVVVVFAALSVLIKQVAYAAAIGILVPVSMPLTAIAYEEREGSQKFVVASGIPRAAIVGEKYLLGLLFWLWSAAAYTTAYFILGAEGGAVEFVLPLCLPLVVLSAVLPLVAKFGVEKARAYMIAVIVVFMALYVALMPVVRDAAANALVLTLCLAGAAIAVFVLSFLLSVKIYRRREF